MRYFVFLLSFFLGVFSSAQAQRKYLRQVVHDRVVVNSPDSTVVTYVWPVGNKEVEAEEEKVYYWYKADKVRTSRGGFGGKVLHGDYTSFYIDQNLKEKGKFVKGLKVGTWKAWYPNGELKEIMHWKKGQRNGSFITYRSDHTIYKTGKYKDDKLKGKVKEYDEAGKRVRHKKAKTPKLKKTSGRRFLFFKRKAKDTTSAKTNKKVPKTKKASLDSTNQAAKKAVQPCKNQEGVEIPCPDFDKKKKVAKPKKKKEPAAKKEENTFPPEPGN
jgi:hypothetical protein